jgi:hypothetical protein
MLEAINLKFIAAPLTRRFRFRHGGMPEGSGLLQVVACAFRRSR